MLNVISLKKQFQAILMTSTMLWLSACNFQPSGDPIPNNGSGGNSLGVSISALFSNPTNLTNVSYQASGLSTGDYVRLFFDSSCASEITNGIFTSPATNYSFTGLIEGTYSIYAVVTIASTSLTSSCIDLATNFTVDTTNPAAPAGFSLTTPTHGSISNQINPVLVTAGLGGELGGTIDIFNGAGCGSNVGSATISGASQSLNATLIAGADDGIVSFYARVTDEAGNQSACTDLTLGFTLDTTAPANPVGWTLDNITNGSTSNQNSPQISASGLAAENGGVIRVYDDNTCTNLLDTQTIIAGGATLTFTLGSDATYAFYGLVEDTIGNQSACTDLSLGYTLDTSAPTAPTIVINTGDAATASTTLNLTLSAVGATQMYITETAGCSAGGSWVPYATLDTIVTTQTDTTATIYVKYRDSSLNETACVSDDIIHDSVAPSVVTAPVLGNDGLVNQSDTTSWTAATDSLSGISHYEIAVSTDNTEGNIIAGGAYTNIGNVLSGNINSGITLVKETDYYTLIKAVDNVGNESTFVPAGPWRARFAPDRVRSLSTVSIAFDEVELGWVAPDANDSPIIDYEIEYKEDSSGTWIVLADGINTMTNATISGLTDDTTYNFRVRAVNAIGNGNYSTTLTADTPPNDPFFAGGNKAMNVGGATTSKVVAYNDSTIVQLNGSTIATLNKGQTHGFISTLGDVIEADGPIFVAGRKGSGGNTSKGNIVWNTPDWAGKTFLINATRNNAQRVDIYAFETANVTIYNGAAVLDSATVTGGTFHTFTFSVLGSFKMTSDKFILGYHIAQGSGTLVVDPKPLLPVASDVIGFPSNSMRLTSVVDGNNYSYTYSDDTTNTGTVNEGGIHSLIGLNDAAQGGQSSLYRSHALRVIADNGIIGNSYADANGNCAAPFMPTAFMRTKYALNVRAQWVAFASTAPAVIQVLDSSDTVVDTITLYRAGSSADAPYKEYRTTNIQEGYRFVSSTRFAAWYEPFNDTNGADDDETIMYGTDD